MSNERRMKKIAVGQMQKKALDVYKFTMVSMFRKQFLLSSEALAFRHVQRCF